jgi:hypothetical protein
LIDVSAEVFHQAFEHIERHPRFYGLNKWLRGPHLDALLTPPPEQGNVSCFASIDNHKFRNTRGIKYKRWNVLFGSPIWRCTTRSPTPLRLLTPRAGLRTTRRARVASVPNIDDELNVVEMPVVLRSVVRSAARKSASMSSKSSESSFFLCFVCFGILRKIENDYEIKMERGRYFKKT